MKMRESENVEPPRWADRLLSWYCRPEALEDLQGDLHELFARHKGLGFQLYSMLIKQLSTLGFHAVIAGIALPNEASIALFESDSQGLQVIITNFYLIDFMFFSIKANHRSSR